MLHFKDHGPSSRANHHQRQPSQRICLAALRALSAAETYLHRKPPVTLDEAALRHGSCVVYVRAGVVVLKSHDQNLVARVLHGELPILAAAKLLEPQVKAIEALKAADPMNLAAIYAATGFTDDLAKLLSDKSIAERTAAAAKLGVAKVWDDMVAPLTS